MLGGLSRLYENQLIVVPLTDFLHCRRIEGTRRGPFNISRTGYANKGFLFNNETGCINLDRFSSVLQFTTTGIPKELLDFSQLLLHEIEHGPFITNDGCQSRDLLLETGMLFFQGHDIRIGQAVQLQGNNSFCLFFREIVADLEVFFSICLIIRSTDQGDDFIENGNDADQALYNVEATFCLFLIKARASDNDIPTVSNVAREDWYDPHLTRGIVVNCHHIEVIVDLQVCILEQVVQDQICIGIFLQLNGNAKPISVRLISNLSDTRHLVVNTNIVNLLDQNSLVDLIRDFGNDDLLLTAFELLDLCLRADNHPALTSFIGFLDLISSLYNGTSWEVRPR